MSRGTRRSFRTTAAPGSRPSAGSYCPPRDAAQVAVRERRRRNEDDVRGCAIAVGRAAPIEARARSARGAGVATRLSRLIRVRHTSVPVATPIGTRRCVAHAAVAVAPLSAAAGRACTAPVPHAEAPCPFEQVVALLQHPLEHELAVHAHCPLALHASPLPHAWQLAPPTPHVPLLDGWH